jgi:hypothetical protein
MVWDFALRRIARADVSKSIDWISIDGCTILHLHSTNVFLDHIPRPNDLFNNQASLAVSHRLML